ncbi:replication-relaxation family protein [Yinghuangia soli]|uniref:Replication-relaxation family protein n=1 Tax=Yinghuangia soli TaxID=2908204 RepID=A0AA41U2Y8_9ACTN|nr:replication-relaxation family protein [Yinghuangia soli]MCF2531181.1 replication-relaxation family protein [Yinghuangia soli]
MINRPTPQQALRGAVVPRPTTTMAMSAGHLGFLANRLTPRDRWLAHMLYEHRVLTTRQITELAWSRQRVANLRLLNLYRWRVLDRFQPRLAIGTAQMHYVLDVGGAAVLAYEHDLEPKQLGFNVDRALGIAHSLRLAHTLGVNDFFSALINHGRQSGSPGRLTAWWSEARCAELFGDAVRPDAYGRWDTQDNELEWFLEYDTGSERPATRLATKIAGYARLAVTTGIVTPVLFWTSTVTREAAIRRALAESVPYLADPAVVPIATASIEQAVLDEAIDPSQAGWLPLSRQATTRMPLIDLTAAWPNVTPPPSDVTAPQAPVATPNAAARGSIQLAPPSPMPPSPDSSASRR